MPKPEMTDATATDRLITRFYALGIMLLGVAIGWFVYSSTFSEDSRFPFKLGLDLAGGSHLVYEADASSIAASEVPAIMNVLRDVIERRVNIFGVSEPIVQVEESSFVSGQNIQRLVVELPGVSNVTDAVAEIGKTPLLEFKLVDEAALATSQALESFESGASSTVEIGNVSVNGATVTDPYLDTGLTGRYLESASLEFAGQSGQVGLANEPIVSIRFNTEGADIFAALTGENIGERLAIFLDGELLSAPRINEAIIGGQAIISGGFTPDEARALAENLNFGALPIPITLVSTQTVGASLGGEVLEKGMVAGGVGLMIVIGFMVVWYRLPGLVAGLSLLAYVVLMLFLFKLIPVTLTAAGLAGLILSIGMAVDANVLVFERLKEEYRLGKSSNEAARIGFEKAWSAIRDSNATSLLSALILFWFGTSIVKGFALVFGLGIVVSMISALIVTRTLLLALPATYQNQNWFSQLYKSGFGK